MFKIGAKKFVLEQDIVCMDWLVPHLLFISDSFQSTNQKETNTIQKLLAYVQSCASLKNFLKSGMYGVDLAGNDSLNLETIYLSDIDDFSSFKLSIESVEHFISIKKSIEKRLQALKVQTKSQEESTKNQNRLYQYARSFPNGEQKQSFITQICKTIQPKYSVIEVKNSIPRVVYSSFDAIQAAFKMRNSKALVFFEASKISYLPHMNFPNDNLRSVEFKEHGLIKIIKPCPKQSDYIYFLNETHNQNHSGIESLYRLQVSNMEIHKYQLSGLNSIPYKHDDLSVLGRTACILSSCKGAQDQQHLIVNVFNFEDKANKDPLPTCYKITQIERHKKNKPLLDYGIMIDQGTVYATKKQVIVVVFDIDNTDDMLHSIQFKSFPLDGSTPVAQFQKIDFQNTVISRSTFKKLWIDKPSGPVLLTFLSPMNYQLFRFKGTKMHKLTKYNRNSLTIVKKVELGQLFWNGSLERIYLVCPGARSQHLIYISARLVN